MTTRERLRWAAPVLLAAAMPLASRLVVWLAATGEPFASSTRLLMFHMVWAAMPFAALSVLVVFTKRPWAQVRMAMGVGLVLLAAVWGWTTWDGVLMAADPTAGRTVGLDILRLGAPVALLSIMVTAAAVRAAFVPRPSGVPGSVRSEDRPTSAQTNR